MRTGENLPDSRLPVERGASTGPAVVSDSFEKMIQDYEKIIYQDCSCESCRHAKAQADRLRALVEKETASWSHTLANMEDHLRDTDRALAAKERELVKERAAWEKAHRELASSDNAAIQTLHTEVAQLRYKLDDMAKACQGHIDHGEALQTALAAKSEELERLQAVRGERDAYVRTYALKSKEADELQADNDRLRGVMLECADHLLEGPNFEPIEQSYMIHTHPRPKLAARLREEAGK